MNQSGCAPRKPHVTENDHVPSKDEHGPFHIGEILPGLMAGLQHMVEPSLNDEPSQQQSGSGYA